MPADLQCQSTQFGKRLKVYDVGYITYHYGSFQLSSDWCAAAGILGVPDMVDNSYEGFYARMAYLLSFSNRAQLILSQLNHSSVKKFMTYANVELKSTCDIRPTTQEECKTGSPILGIMMNNDMAVMEISVNKDDKMLYAETKSACFKVPYSKPTDFIYFIVKSLEYVSLPLPLTNQYDPWEKQEALGRAVLFREMGDDLAKIFNWCKLVNLFGVEVKLWTQLFE